MDVYLQERCPDAADNGIDELIQFLLTNCVRWAQHDVITSSNIALASCSAMVDSRTPFQNGVSDVIGDVLLKRERFFRVLALHELDTLEKAEAPDVANMRQGADFLLEELPQVLAPSLTLLDPACQ